MLVFGLVEITKNAMLYLESSAPKFGPLFLAPFKSRKRDVIFGEQGSEIRTLACDSAENIKRGLLYSVKK